MSSNKGTNDIIQLSVMKNIRDVNEKHMGRVTREAEIHKQMLEKYVSFVGDKIQRNSETGAGSEVGKRICFKRGSCNFVTVLAYSKNTRETLKKGKPIL